MRRPRLSSDPARVGGPALRPSAAWTPARLGGKVLWLRASSLVGTANGAAVSTWRDESGAGHDATQGTAGNQPTFASSWTNGQPAVSFNGSQWLAVSSTLTTGATWTVAVVFQFSTVAVQNAIVGVGGTTGYALLSTGGARTVAAKGSAFAQDGASATSPVTWIAQRSGGTMSLYVDGVLQSLTNASATVSDPNTDSAIGSYLNTTSTTHMTGYIAEIVVCGTAWDSTTRGLWAGYSKRLYNI